MGSPKVSLEQWRILHTIISEGGFAQAAKKLNKSQSSISYAIARMQEQLGMEILTLNGRKAELTEAGQLLLRRSKTLLSEAECLEAAAHALNSGWEPEISIAMEILFPPELLMQALEKLAKDAPHTRVEIIESVMSGTSELVDQKAVDMAICSQLTPGTNGMPLLDVEFALVASPTHPLACQQEPVTFSQLGQHRQIIIRDTGAQRKGVGGWQKAEQRWTFSSFATAKSALINGYGFSWSPIPLIEEELNKGLIVPLQLQPESGRRTTLYLTYPEAETLGPAVKKLEGYLLEAVETYHLNSASNNGT
ncbi:LysR family transcriptional regulator [Sneathiella glossodoripedis]|uniref:LysR family transcriptional regulator n=1 Tax=Sneathiella glossodoripedis TaxID=418853 RepID=UPI0004722716|nr:LysR family transcriptional regulator [Sneathiella glossodoripedis]